MKITVLTVILLVLAVIIAVGSVTVLGPCVHEDGSEAPCTGTGRAILADGILLAVLSVFLLFIKAPKMRLILFMITAVAALAGILMPGTLLPVCKMDTMHCRMVMQPAIIILFALALLTSACGTMAEISKNRKHGK
ncbi:MAG: DUF4418 family protein [Clostridia bacterium]|nr:DUF4418 family protein [Clostridia bacterium]